MAVKCKSLGLTGSEATGSNSDDRGKGENSLQITDKMYNIC